MMKRTLTKQQKLTSMTLLRALVMKMMTNPACPEKTTFEYPPVAVGLVGGGATSHSRLVRNGLPSFP